MSDILQSAPSDVGMCHFQDPILRKFEKMVRDHNNGMLGEQIMFKLYAKIKEIQLAKGKNAVIDPATIIKQAIENVRPVMRLEKVKVGGNVYLVPGDTIGQREKCSDRPSYYYQASNRECQ